MKKLSKQGGQSDLEYKMVSDDDINKLNESFERMEKGMKEKKFSSKSCLRDCDLRPQQKSSTSSLYIKSTNKGTEMASLVRKKNTSDGNLDINDLRSNKDGKNLSSSSTTSN